MLQGEAQGQAERGRAGLGGRGEGWQLKAAPEWRSAAGARTVPSLAQPPAPARAAAQPPLQDQLRWPIVNKTGMNTQITTNYWGASLWALTDLGRQKGYTLVACDKVRGQAAAGRQRRRGSGDSNAWDGAAAVSQE